MKLLDIINNILSLKSEQVSKPYLQGIISSFNLNYPVILITGTNGKGSVCAYISTILKLAGYKVGTYTSPHLLSYNERISINGVNVADDLLSESLLTIMEMVKYHDHPFGLFKLFTLVAHKIFIEQEVDIVVCEVGIGGAADITNFFKHDISIITRVALDHCEILGTTREEIGLEKAKIFQTDKPAIYGEEDIPDSVINYASEIKANLVRFGHDFNIKLEDRNSWNYLDLHHSSRCLYSLPLPLMRGQQQILNAATAICALHELQNLPQYSQKFTINMTNIKQGILQTKLLGRFDILAGYPRVIMDVAHNPDAVANMINNMIQLGLKDNIAVFALAKDKDLKNIIKNSRPHFKKWYISRIDSDRSCSVEEIARELMLQGVLNEDIMQFGSVSEAMQAALKQRVKDYNLIVFGSFLTVAESYKLEFYQR